MRTTTDPAPSPTPVRATVLARRSLMTLPQFVAVYIFTTVLGVWFRSLLGLHEGDLLLMAHNAGGWAAEVALTLLLLGPATAGTAYAVASLRRGGPRLAWLWLVLNGLCVAVTLYMFADGIRMSYFPGD